MPIPLTYLEMQLWIGTTTHSDRRFISPHLQEHLPADVVHHLLYNGYKINGDNMDIIKTILRHIEDKPLWAAVIIIAVMYIFG